MSNNKNKITWTTTKYFEAEYTVQCEPHDVEFTYNGIYLLASQNPSKTVISSPICFGSNPDDWETLGKWLIKAATEFRKETLPGFKRNKKYD